MRAYHLFPVTEDDITKTAINSPFGLYEFCRMPFGLRNVAQTFQRFIDGVCYDLDFVLVYLDHILFASSSLDEHLQHLRVLFQRLLVQGLVISPAKWSLANPNWSSRAIPLTPMVSVPTWYPSYIFCTGPWQSTVSTWLTLVKNDSTQLNVPCQRQWC